VAAHALAPVTVVRGHWRPVLGHDPRPVVVGTDGSPGARAALAFAVGAAALRAAPLVAVCALSDAAGILGTARTIEADFITATGKAHADHPEVLVQKRVDQGAPRSALLAAASQSAARGGRARPGRPARDDAGLGQPRRPAPRALPGDSRARSPICAQRSYRRLRCQARPPRSPRRRGRRAATRGGNRAAAPIGHPGSVLPALACGVGSSQAPTLVYEPDCPGLESASLCRQSQ
jgi:hypothetical protein